MCLLVNKCCFCISLEVGTKVIAVLSLVCSLISVILYAGAAMSLSDPTQTKHSFYVLVAAISVCQSVFCSLLLYGAFGGKPSYLWPWLVTSWISCIVLVLVSLLGVILLIIQYYEDVDTLTNITNMSTFYFVDAVIVYYCVMVVQSRRLQLIRAAETESADKLIQLRNMPKSLLV